MIASRTAGSCSSAAPAPAAPGLSAFRDDPTGDDALIEETKRAVRADVGAYIRPA